MARVFDQALAYLRTPDHLAARQQALPSDLGPLLRVAAGEAEALATAARQTGASPAVMREAAALYLQQLLFAGDGDSYRVLGVNPDASEEQIKDHHRWLVRWLHPDRNPDGWEADYVTRVNAAWQNLRNHTRRDEYDRLHSGRACGTGRPGSPGHWRPRREEEARPETGLLSPRAVRALPMVVLGGLGTIAVLALLLVYAWQPVVVEALSGQEASLKAEARSAWLAETDAAPEPDPVPEAENTNPDTDAQPPREPDTAPVVRTEAGSSASTPPVDVSSAVIGERPEPTRLPVFIPVPTAAAGSAAAALKSTEPPAPVHQAPPAKHDMPAGSSSPEPDRLAGQNASAHDDSPSPELAPAPAPIQAVVPQVHPRVTQPLPATLANRTAAATPPPAARPPGLIEAPRAHALVEDFSRAYQAGDIAALARLFASGEGSGNSRDRILREYRRLFRDSGRRSMQVSNRSWVSRGTRGTIFGSFDARISPVGRGKERRIRGDIRFDLREEGGQLRIVDLRHDGTQG